MSQSDYIKYKKSAVELKNQTFFPPILESDDYTDYKQYATGNNVYNTCQTYNELIPPHKTRLFDIERSYLTTCPTFIVDHDTQTRPNRIPMKQAYAVPVPVPLYVKHPQSVCANCCADTTSKMANKKTNNANTSFTSCRLRRLKNTLCSCSGVHV